MAAKAVVLSADADADAAVDASTVSAQVAAESRMTAVAAPLTAALLVIEICLPTDTSPGAADASSGFIPSFCPLRGPPFVLLASSLSAGVAVTPPLRPARSGRETPDEFATAIGVVANRACAVSFRLLRRRCLTRARAWRL